MKTTANTISRWETATYKPSISDLERLARFFGVPVSDFFPGLGPSSQVHALLSATCGVTVQVPLPVKAGQIRANASTYAG